MPVEIRELVIRAVVNSDPPERSSGPSQVQPADPQAIDAIVEACVRQVLKILKNSEAR